MREFFAMGGYALYVWGAYGVTFALLAVEVVVLLKRKRETKTEAHRVDRARRRGAGHRDRARALRLQQEPGVFLHAVAGGGEGGAGRAHVPHRRHGGAGQPEARG